MHSRNPFTSISNLSFVRNKHQLSDSRPISRSCSSKKYFDYGGPLIRDTYLMDCEFRRSRAYQQRKVMGLDSLRYTPSFNNMGYSNDKWAETEGEYYNVDTFANEDKHSLIPEIHHLKENLENHIPFKNSTRDMFGSDYFGNRNQEEQGRDEKMDSYQLLMVKKTSAGQRESRFKQESESCRQQSEQDSGQSKFQEEDKCEENKSQQQVLSDQPLTLFLKSRGKLYFLQPQQDC